MTHESRITEDAEHSGFTRRRVLQVGAAATGLVVADAAATGGAAFASETSASAPSRRELSFDESWRFLRGDAAGAEARTFEDSHWRVLDVPHDWGVDDLPTATSTDGGATADPSTMAFQTTPPPAGTPTAIGPFDSTLSVGGKPNAYTVSGIGWYRKHFTAPAGSTLPGARTLLRFEGVFHNATVWLNGTQLGSHVYGYTPFVLDLTGRLSRGVNVLAVKVDNTSPDERWYTGYGINRHTWLSVVPAVRVPDDGIFITTPSISRARAGVHVAAESTNADTKARAVTARVTITDARGHRVATKSAKPVTVAAGATTTIGVDLSVLDPSLWAIGHPSLYSARTDLLVEGRVVDTITTSFGIRSVVFDGQKGLLINGVATKIRGGNLHAGYGPLGGQVLGRSVERQVEILKAAGFNAIRTAHNPAAEYLLDVCDRLGVLVWDEAFDKWSGGEFPADYVDELTTFIRRDRNHPSVIIWSTGNEVSDPVLGKALHDQVKLLDPTRAATQGATPMDTAADTQYQYTDVTDVHYNNTDHAPLRALYPNRAMTQSESWPGTIYDDWKMTQENAWFVGSWVWAAWDYMGESGAGATITAAPGTVDSTLPPFGTGPFPWYSDYQGDIDLIGQRKPQNFWRSVVYDLSTIEMLVERPAPAGKVQYAHFWSYYDELESWTWDVTNGQAMTVHVYTSGDSVTLRLNGKTVATKAVVETDRRVATFQVPYSPGELVAVASRAGRTIGSKTLTTVGAPAAVRLTSDVRTLTTARDDLAHVLVEIVDAHGRIVPDAVQKVSFATSGAGELLAAGNGNPHNIDSFHQGRRWTWHGKALAVVRPAKNPGHVRLAATASGLRSDTITIPVGR